MKKASVAKSKAKARTRYASTAISVTISAAILWKLYRYVTRDPGDEWLQEYLQRNTGQVANLWIPGIGTRAGQTKQEVDDMVKDKLIPGECEIAFFPYSSLSLPMDLLVATIDKMQYGSLRPQVKNIAKAISILLERYKSLFIVCHSHGAMLLKQALWMRGVTDEESSKITINCFGPAELVPYRCPRYKVAWCLNWVVVEDVLVTRKVLDIPEELLTKDNIERETTRHFEWGREEFYSTYVYSLKRVPATAIGKHTMYPYSIGVFCPDKK